MVKNRRLGSVWAIFRAKIIFIRFGVLFKIFENLKFFPAKILKFWHFWPSNFQSWPISGQKILKMCLSKSYLFPNKNAGDRSEKLWMCSKNSENSHFSLFLTWTGSRGFPLCPTEFHFVLQIFKKFKISAFAQYIHCWTYSLHKKSYSTLKFRHTTVSHLCIEFSHKVTLFPQRKNYKY